MSPARLQTDRIAWGRILALLTSGATGAFAVMVLSVSAERLTVEQEDSGATLSILGTSPTEAELGGDDPGTVGFQLGLGTTRDAVRASGLSCAASTSRSASSE